MSELLFDVLAELPLGVDRGRDVSLLSNTQCASAVNVTFRGGLARTRPAFVHVPVNLPVGLFQGCTRWRLEYGDSLVFVASGRVYLLELWSSRLMNFGRHFSSSSQCRFVSVRQYLIVMDGKQYPVVLEERVGGVVARRSFDIFTQSLPRAEMAVFANERLHMVPSWLPTADGSGRHSLISGDILEPLYPRHVLRFSETQYLHEGGAHSLPVDMGFIGAVGVFRNVQNGTGSGHVIAIGEDGACAFDFSLPRDMWKQQALSQVLFFGNGCRSPWGITNVNNDLLYRATDGIRAVRFTASQAGGSSGALHNVSLSTEVEPWFTADRDDVGFAQLAFSNQRIYTTVGVRKEGALRGYSGLVVGDVAAAHYSGAGDRIVYDGLWTGPHIAGIVTACPEKGSAPVLYVFTHQLALYRLDEHAAFDAEYTPIVSRIESPAFVFGEAFSPKDLQYIEIWVKNVRVNGEITVWYRPVGYALWQLAGARRLTVPEESMPQYRARVRIAVDHSEVKCDPITGRALWLATAFQIAVQWTGRMTLERLLLTAQRVPEISEDACDSSEGVVLAPGYEGVVLDEFGFQWSHHVMFSEGELGGVWPPEHDPWLPPEGEPGFPGHPRLPPPPPLDEDVYI